MLPLQGTLHVPELVIFLFAELGVTSYICNALRNNITYVVTNNVMHYRIIYNKYYILKL